MVYCLYTVLESINICIQKMAEGYQAAVWLTSRANLHDTAHSLACLFIVSKIFVKEFSANVLLNYTMQSSDTDAALAG